MTKDSLSETAALRALLSETCDTRLLAEMLGFVADRLMALDIDQLCGASAHERSADRVNRRNGCRPRCCKWVLNSFEHVIGCGHVSGLDARRFAWPLAGMEIRGAGPDHSGELGAL